MKKSKVNIDTTVEEFTQLIINKETTFVVLKREINSGSFSKEKVPVLSKRLEVANERIHKNLKLNEILFYILIPSRKLHGFSKKYYFDTDKVIKEGYKRKVNQYYGFSILGHFLYINSFNLGFQKYA